MTALLDLHPDSDHPVVSGLAVIEDALDQILVDTVTPLASGDYATVVAGLERAARRVEAVKLRIAAADRSGIAQQSGFTDTDAWLARQTTTSRSNAAREVGLARDLTSGGHDTTAQALDAGQVSAAHAAVILHAARLLPTGVSDEQRRVVEASLVEKARRFNPDRLRRAARRAVEAIEPDEKVVDADENEKLRTEEETARDRCTLSMRDNGDGTTSGHFTVPTLAAAVLKKIIESMTAPRRMRETRTSHTPHTPCTAGAPERSEGTDRSAQRPDRSYDWSHRRGLALAELLEHLPTDHLHHKSAATVVVTINHETLTGALRAAHLDTGQQLSAGEARRLACTSGLLPAVLGGGSLALDLGRECRLFSATQRIAAGLRHDTCAADGCERPFAWCELHHLQPWTKGGRTDLANAVPLCSWHHQRIHDHTYTHRRLPGGTLSFSRRR